MNFIEWLIIQWYNVDIEIIKSLFIELKETAIKIALDSKGNVRKRKIAVPLLMILGIVIIISSLLRLPIP